MLNLSGFAVVLVFVIGAVLFLAVGLLLSKIIRPHKPNVEKLSPYESGEEPLGDAWNTFNSKYYTIAIVFLLFEVELLFLFPWAVVFDNENLQQETNQAWGWFSLAEMGVFIGVLVLALAFAWKNGFIDWVKPVVEKSDFTPVVPKEVYEKVNEKYG